MYPGQQLCIYTTMHEKWNFTVKISENMLMLNPFILLINLHVKTRKVSAPSKRVKYAY